MPDDTTPIATPLRSSSDISAVPFLGTSRRSPSEAPLSVPLVVQVGFAGSRNLFDLSMRLKIDSDAFQAQTYEALLGILHELPAALGMSPHHFLRGVSQVAVGADILFTRALGTPGIPQRVLLPQNVDESRLTIATRLFWLFSPLAIVTTVLELLGHVGWLYVLFPPLSDFVHDWGPAFAGFLPVAAIGFLSWAAASDPEARAQTFADARDFLERQRRRLGAAASRPEFGRLARETEARLLGENLNWFWRRSFTSVT